MQDDQSLLSGLPNDALVHAVAFLSTRDALQLSSLNSTFRQTLSFSTLQDPVPLFESKTWHGTQDEESNTPRRSVWIPVKFRHKTHSVVLSCQWRDQGFGNRKGTLFVVAVPASDDPNHDALELIENGTVVYESPVAPHAEESFQFSFAYSPEKAYYVWYRVGGGGGHQLRVNNLSMRTIIYDDAEKWIGRNYKTLCSNGFVENHSAFSLDMLLSIATVPETSRAHFSGFLQRNGLVMTEASMQALKEVAMALQEYQEKKVAHDALPPPRNIGRPGVREGRRVALFAPGRQVETVRHVPTAQQMELLQEIDEALQRHEDRAHLARELDGVNDGVDSDEDGGMDEA